MDSGTDWSHPDLIGAKVATAANGWPAAFDPFGTVQWLLAPEQIDQGLSWYVRTTAAACGGSGSGCSVQFATKTGPSRTCRTRRAPPPTPTRSRGPSPSPAPCAWAATRTTTRSTSSVSGRRSW
jgi:hypothetical protein